MNLEEEEERRQEGICQEHLDVDDWDESANPQDPDVSDITVEHLTDFIQEKTTFAMFGSPRWDEDVPTAVRAFLKDPSRMAMFLCQRKSCVYVQLDPPNLDTLDMCWYCLKMPPCAMTADADVEDVENLQFGTLKADDLMGCQQRAFSLFRNEILGKCGVENHPEMQYLHSESTKHFYSFMSKFIKSCAVNMHRSILVAPGAFAEKSDLGKGQVNTLANAKSLEYLEVLSLTWIQQCNELTSSEMTNAIGQAKDPLEDLTTLKPRLKALTHLNEELNGDFVKQMTSLLTSEKSPFMTYFGQLTLDIVVRNLNIVQDSVEMLNLRRATLTPLEDSCHKLHNSSTKDAPLHLADLVDQVAKFHEDTGEKRESPYSTDDLVKMVCNSVIGRCESDISTDNICRGYKSSVGDINEATDLCDLCRTMFLQASNQRRIKFNKEIGFKRIELFVRRCKDLIKICEGAELFGQWTEGDSGYSPSALSRPHQRYFDTVLLEIMQIFDRFLENLSKNQSQLLDLDSLKWTSIERKYEDILAKVEMLCRNSVNDVFKPETEVEEGIEILSYFSHLSKQRGVDRLYVDKANVLFQRCLVRIPSVRSQISQLGHLFRTDDQRLTDIAVMAHDLERKIAEPMESIAKAHWLPTTALGELTKAELSKLHLTIEDFISKIFVKWTQQMGKFKFAEKLNVPPIGSTNCEFLELNLERNTLENLKNAIFWQKLGRDVQLATGSSSETCVAVVNLFQDAQETIDDYNRTVEALLQRQISYFISNVELLHGFIGQTWLTLTTQCPEYNDWKAAIVQLKEKYTLFNTTQDRINNALEDFGKLSLLIFDNTDKLPMTMEEYEAIKNQRFEEFCDKGYEIYRGISLDLMTMKSTFQEQSEKTEYEWLNLLDDKDRLFDKSITTCISKSLLEVESFLSDKEKYPILRIKIGNNNEVSQNKNTQLPMVTILDDMLALVNRFPSFRDIMTKADVTHTRQLIPGSRDILECIYQRISATVKEVFGGFLNSISRWAQYEEILDVNQEVFFEAYRKSEPKSQTVEQDASGYSKIERDMEAMEPLSDIGFLQIDYTELRKDLLDLAGSWKARFREILPSQES